MSDPFEYAHLSGMKCFLYCLLVLTSALHASKRVAYIYGDVAADGTIPSGDSEPYDQMLLTDSGDTGLSIFKAMVEGEGYTITQHYDADIDFDSDFVNSFDVIIFGLHQRVWTEAEQLLLDEWIRRGGGILMYNDSAAGGRFNLAGINNPTGQMAVNSILSRYDMQVTVDQGGGTRAYEAPADSTNPIVYSSLIFEGEGVSPVAVDPNGIAEAIIPLDPSNRISGSNLSINATGVTISNPEWAVIGHASVERGHVMAIFDRQPMWNDGPGSDIEKRDNQEILRRIVRYLARDYGNSSEWLGLELLSGEPTDFQLSYRQWLGGAGSSGYNYVARNNQFAVEQRQSLSEGDWRSEPELVEFISSSPLADGESERVTVRLLPDAAVDSWMVRAFIAPSLPPPSVVVGRDQWVQSSGSAWLDASVSGANSQMWMKVSGPGNVSFQDSNSTQTTATFSAPGEYELKMVASNATVSAEDSLTVTVIDANDVVFAINCGGATYQANNGFDYIADVYFDGGGVDGYPGNGVTGTDDDLLYNYARSKNNTFTGYTIPVPDGNYLVLLQFAETYFNDDNKRVFDVSIEGQLLLDDLDLHVEAPGKWVAYDRAFTTSVSDALLEIDVSASVNNPLLNALVVIELP